MVKKSQRIWIIFVGLFIALVAAFAVPKAEEREAHAAADLTISTVSQLQTFRDNVNNGNTYSGQTVELAADLDLSGISNWTPIGNTLDHPFEGTFNGLRHTISGMKTNIAGSGINVCAGLFGYTNNAVVTGVGVVDCNINVSAQSAITGGLIGRMDDGRVANCYVTGIVSNESFSAAGEGGYIGYFIGQLNSGMLTCCYAAGGTGNAFGPTSGSATLHYGPLLGYNNSGKVYESYFPDTLHFVMSGNRTSCNAGTFKTEGQFASGEVTYLLNGSYTPANSVWYQSIDNDLSPHDDFPSFNNSRGKVYGAYKCGQGNTRYYTNTDPAAVSDDQWYPSVTGHSFDNNGFCTRCGAYQACTGAGTSASPYQIGNTGQLYWFAAVVNNELDKCASPPAQRNTAACGILTDDIVINEDISSASARLWTPIGIDNNSANYYTGTFNGNNHTISGMKVDITGAAGYVYAGLFGYTYGSASKIQNVGLENFDVTVSSSTVTYAGGLAGYQNSSTITDCYATGAVSATGTGSNTVYTGGLVGCQHYGSITGSYATGYVTATSTGSGLVYTGGLAGYNDIATITNSYATGDVTATTSNRTYAGGLAGYLYGSSGTIIGSYATGAVSATGTGSNTVYAGGLVAYQNSSTIITDCYATGEVTGNNNNSNYSIVGGLVGYQSGSAKIMKSYATGNVTAGADSNSNGSKYAGGLVGQMSNSIINNAYATGTVTAKNSNSSSKYVGGLVGEQSGSSSIISNTYAIGDVVVSGSGTKYVGKLVGRQGGSATTVNNSYYLNSSAIPTSGVTTLTVGTSKTSDQFASGEVTCLLNGEDGTTISSGGTTWYQSLDNNVGPDTYPRLEEERGKVYYNSKPCGKSAPLYSNYNNSSSSHSFDSNGFCTNCGAYQTPSGSGTSGSPYLIDNAGKLYWFACVVNNDSVNCEDYYASNSRNVSACAKLTANITIPEGRLWKPIGKWATGETDAKENAYKGTFDGNNKTISGVNVNIVGGATYVDAGFFGRAYGATISNLKIENPSISAVTIANSTETRVGGLVGMQGGNSTIVNCELTNASVFGRGYGGTVSVGGLIGVQSTLNSGEKCTLNNCKLIGNSTVKCESTNATGTFGAGLVGNQYRNNGSGNYDIVDCTTAGTVTSEGYGWVGGAGIVGFEGGTTTMTDCSSSCNVNVYNKSNDNDSGKNTRAGGLSFFQDVSEPHTATNCHATGDIYLEADNQVTAGGAFSYLRNATVRNCSATGKVTVKHTCTSTWASVGGFAGAIYEVSTIENCSATYSGSGDSVIITDAKQGLYCGGFTGYSGTDGSSVNTIRNCYSTRNVSSTVSSTSASSFVGGFAGQLGATNNEYNYATGNVYANVKNTSSVGGYVGYYYATQNNSYCMYNYSTGSVVVDSSTTGNICTGGFTGYVYCNNNSITTNIQDCYTWSDYTVRATGNNVTIDIGGFGGSITRASGGTIRVARCYATGKQKDCTYPSSKTLNCGRFTGTCNYYADKNFTLSSNSVTSSGSHWDGGNDLSLCVFSEADYSSGKVAALLNGYIDPNYTTNNTNISSVDSSGPWHQNLTGSGRDAFPILDENHSKVYTGLSCNGSTRYYTNDETYADGHNFDSNGFCTVCGKYQSCAGEGTSEDPYIIDNAGKLYWFACVVNSDMYDKCSIAPPLNKSACAKLTADITINENVDSASARLWYPIGRYDGTDNYQFTGSIDGNNHTISGMKINMSNTSWTRSGVVYAGLVGYAGPTIKDLTVENARINVVNNSGTATYGFAGVFAGNATGTYTNCKAKNSTVTLTNNSHNFAGGFIGNTTGTFTNCSTENCTVTANTSANNLNAGGFAGRINSSTVTNCSSSGSVTGTSTGSGYVYAGGFVGNSDSNIARCYSNNTVTVTRGNSATNVWVGGFVGYYNSSSSTVTDSYSNSNVIVTDNCTGTSVDYHLDVGGFVGLTGNHSISNCYATGNVTMGGTTGGYASCAGGFVGRQGGSGSISKSYATGTVVGQNKRYLNVGGFAGSQGADGTVQLNYCYATGSASATGSNVQNIAGGLVGIQETSSNAITNSYAIGDVTISKTGTNDAGRLIGYKRGTTVTSTYTLNTSKINGTAGAAKIGSYSYDSTTKTAAQFASGEVTYLLNGSVSGGEIWRQNLSAPVDSYPVLDDTHNKVYTCAACGGSTIYYVNDASASVGNHNFNSDGFCTSCGKYQGCSGLGTSSSPYLIGNAGQLYWFACVVNGDTNSKCAVNVSKDTTVCGNLSENITIPSKDPLNNNLIWTPIGIDNASTNRYAGIFNGNNHTISGMKVNITGATNDVYAGLFGCVYGSKIQNVGLENFSVNASGSSYVYAGGLVGVNMGATITNSYATGNVAVTGLGNKCSGGLVGVNNSGTITNTYAVVDITVSSSGTKYVGKLVGYQVDGGTVNNSYYLDSSAIPTSGVTTLTVGTSKTSDQFASGEVTCLLNGEDGTTISSGGTTWYQSINNGVGPDAYPRLDEERGIVYRSYRCGHGSTLYYTNTDPSAYSDDQWVSSVTNHSFNSDGFCRICDAYQAPTSGTGATSSPYQITNAGQLYWFAAVVNGDLDKCEDPSISRNTSACANLMNDIVINEDISSASARLWTPIGTLRGNVSLDGYENAYKGTFDGQNYTISGMKVDITGATGYFCAGLFGGIDSGTIQNVGILNSSIRCLSLTDISAGGLVGAVASIDHTKSSNIINCYSNVMINAQGSTSYHTFSVGGLLGRIADCCNVTNSYATGDVNITGSEGGVIAGGLVGSEGSSGATITINNCYATGDVIATDSAVYAGGFVGAREVSSGASSINNAYATGNVIATGSQGIAAGGFAGGQACGSSSDTCDISNVYAVGDVTASGSDTCYVGRLVGRSELATVTNSYYLSTSSISGATPTDLGTSKTEAEFNSGEVTYLLNQGQELTWYQSVDNELSPHDPYPLFDSDRGIVYNGYKCNSSTLSYSNKELHAEPNSQDHDFTDNNGFCRICDAYQAPAIGTGASGSPYQITNAGQLYWFAAVVNNDLDKCADAPAQQNLSACGKLMNDIVINEDLSSGNARLWTPIANDTSASNVNYYKGTFDGQNHTISGMKVDITGVSGYVYAGLFGKAQTMTIANIGIVNSSVNVSGSASYTYAGGLIGYQNHVLNNCYADVEVTVSCSSGYSYAGGLMGYHSANVTNSYATGNVTATTTGSSNIYVGGLAGYKGGGSLTSSYATGAVNTTGSRFVEAGGLIGYNNSGTMTDCYATGAVNATATDSNNLYAGGLIGYQNSSVQKSYATGNVTAQQTGTGYAYVGGLSGYINSNSIIECYATGNVTGNNNNGNASYVGGLLGIQISGTSITKSYATGNVTAGADSNSNGYKYAGGLVGQMTSSIINNAYATGTVTAKNSNSSNKYAGGLVGEQFGSSSIISNTYAIGDVVVSGSGEKRVGKLVGYQNGSATTVNNSYYLNSSAIPTSGVTTCTVGTSKTEAQFNSGEETYLLNQGQVITWYQSIDNGASPLDPYPLLDSSRGIVYKGCNEGASTSSDVYYSNSPDTTHTFDADGFCIYCGAYQSCTGAGTSASPYQIGNAGQLYWYAAVVNNALDKCASPPAQRNTTAYGTLTDDIVINDDISSASARLWTPIGIDSNSANYYKGTFEGNNHTISGMKVNITGATSAVYAGFFGYTYSAKIQNVGIINSSVNASGSSSVYAGGLAGYQSSGTITGSYSEGVVTATSTGSAFGYIGGLVGWNASSSFIINSHSTADVTATLNNGYAGGLAGYNNSATITNSYATGDVTNTAGTGEAMVGGLIGNMYLGTLRNNYATGSVTVTSSISSGSSIYTGGLSGKISRCTTQNNYATGSVTTTVSASSRPIYTGGLTGYHYYSSGTTVTYNNYATGAVSATHDGAGHVIAGGLIGYQNTNSSAYNGYSISNITVGGSGTGAKYVGKVIGLQNSGTATNLYYLDSSTITNNTTAGTYTDNTSTLSGATSKTEAEFNSGEVTYLLNQGQELTWYQSVDNELSPHDPYPLFDSDRGIVYNGYKCNSSTLSYSNKELHAEPNNPNHDFTDNNGFCRICDAYQAPATGTGASGSPYQITNAGQLYWFAAVVNNDLDKCEDPSISRKTNACGILMNDIVINEDLSSGNVRLWTPIGKSGNSSDYYTGTFNGNNKTVSNIKINITSTDRVYAGFFGYVSSSSTVQNLGIENVDININDSNTNQYNYAGGLAATGYANNMRGCHVTGNINIHGPARYYGGLFGCKDGTLNDCYVDANIVVDYNNNPISETYAGSLVGYSNTDGINRCYSKGTISAKCPYTGGLVGYARQTTYINNCYSMVDVTSTYTANSAYTGGLVGYLNLNTGYVLSNSYSIGDVSTSSSTKYVGRLVGYKYRGDVTNCYYLSTSALPSGGTTVCNEGTSKTLAQFQSGEETYLLNQGQGITWYQSLDNELSPHDDYPLLYSTRGIVYKGCNEGASTSSDTYYSNSPDTTHTFDSNGFCQYCGAYQACSGAGTSASPYQIGNAGQLYWYAAVVNNALDKCASPPAQRNTTAYGTLTDDIVINDDISSASARLWTPIGTFKTGDPVSGSGAYPNAYKGTFNGNNHTISGMKVNITGATNDVYAGLFGCVYGSSGKIQNIGLENFSVNASGSSYVYAGGLAGYCYSTTMTNSYATGDVTATTSNRTYAGGLAGYCYNTTITSSYATGDVTTATSTGAGVYAGGLAGYLIGSSNTITGNYATGDVTATSTSTGSSWVYAGGLAGYNDSAKITNSYATGDVTATSTGTGSVCAGGLVGYNYCGSTVTRIYNSYATGDVTATSTGSGSVYAGGLVGLGHYATMTNSYATGDVSVTHDGTGYVRAGGLIGSQSSANNSAYNGYSISNITVSGSGTGAKYVGKVIGQQNAGTTTNLYYLDSSTITNNTTAGTYTDNTSTLSGATSKTATEFNNFAVKDLLQTYVDANTTASNQLSSWVQAQNSPEFNWDNHDLVTNISWGNMTFAYDPINHTWSTGTNENKVEFENNSTGAKLRYNAVFTCRDDAQVTVSNVNGTTTHSAGDVTYQGATWPMVNSPEMVVSSSPGTDTRETTLTLNGIPQGIYLNDHLSADNAVEIGTITFTISG